MGIGLQHDIGSYLATAFGMAAVTVTADSSGAGDPQFGVSIDRLAQNRRYLSAKIVGLANVVLTAASSGAVRTANVELALQDSADNVTWADFNGDAAGLGASTDPPIVFGALTATASSTGTPSAGTPFAPFRDVDISRARRYIRTKSTANFSATSSAGGSVALLGVALIFGGADILPAT